MGDASFYYGALLQVALDPSLCPQGQNGRA